MYGGDIIKFAGDALLAVWPADMEGTKLPRFVNHASQSVLLILLLFLLLFLSLSSSSSCSPILSLLLLILLIHPLLLSLGMSSASSLVKTLLDSLVVPSPPLRRCALAMQEQLHNFVVEGCVLRLHIGLGAGKIGLVHVGGEVNLDERRVEFLITGEPLAQVHLHLPSFFSSSSLLPIISHQRKEKTRIEKGARWSGSGNAREGGKVLLLTSPSLSPSPSLTFLDLLFLSQGVRVRTCCAPWRGVHLSLRCCSHWRSAPLRSQEAKANRHATRARGTALS